MNFLAIAFIVSGQLWRIIASTSTFGAIILGILLFMSFVSWIIIFHKWRQFREVDHDNQRFQQHFHRARQIVESVGQAKSTKNSPVSNIFLAGYQELTELKEGKNPGGALQSKVTGLDAEDFEIVEMSMERSLVTEMGKMERRVIFLATTANSAPFLGLLGTVVGIMDSFWAIGERGSASLAVVAPGIAEALLATIVGLAAAIPAVIAFNWANSKMKFINDFSSNFILEFITQAKKEAR
jgi:biopolymer transport protein TolQ